MTTAQIIGIVAVPAAIFVSSAVTATIYAMRANREASRERQEIRDRLTRLETKVEDLIGWMKRIDSR